MKLYKVPIYQVSYHVYTYEELSYVDDVILVKNHGRVKELLTGYSKIDVVPTGAIKNGKLGPTYQKSYRDSKEGAHLICRRASFCAGNRVTLEMLNDYIENYDTSRWKRKYEDMNVLTKNEKQDIKEKVKNVFGSKK